MIQLDMTLGHAAYQSCQPHPVEFQPIPGHGFNSAQDLDISDFKDLMTRYQSCLNCEANSLVSSGGLQQFLNRVHQKRECEMTSCRGIMETCKVEKEMASASSMPDDVLLHIFSFLSPKDLCRTSRVCRRWFHLSNDELLWKHKLNKDVRTWHVIGHMTNPEMYRECESDWSSKEIYLRCSPEFHQMRRREFMHFINISSLLRSLLPRNAPKVAMFGPGLESETSAIFRKILWDKSGDFQRTALIPGVATGMGSGIAFRLQDQLDFHLFTLYSSTKEERTSRQGLSPQQKLQKNKMLKQLVNVEAGEDDVVHEQFELSSSLREVSRKMNAFVYVVNAASDVDDTELRWSRHELFAMVNEQWANPNVPLLVLTCTKDNDTKRKSCANIVGLLQLGKLSRPWQVHDCVVEELEGVAKGLEWLLQRARQS